MFNKIKNTFTVLTAAATAILVSATANAEDLFSITGKINLESAYTGIVAVGAAVGGFLVVALGVRYVLGFLKRV